MSFWKTLFGGHGVTDHSAEGATDHFATELVIAVNRWVWENGCPPLAEGGTDRVVKDILRLRELVMAHRLNGYQYASYEKCPEYDEIRRIGERLSNIGGIELMRMVYDVVNKSTLNPGMSQFWWNGVGGWCA